MGSKGRDKAECARREKFQNIDFPTSILYSFNKTATHPTTYGKNIILNKDTQTKTLVPYLLGLGTAICIACIVFLLSYFVVGKGRIEAEARAHVALDTLRVKLSRELDNMLTMPETMALFIGANPHTINETFEIISRQVLLQHLEIVSIVLAPDSVISKVYPLKGNENIVGLKYLEIPEQAEAVQRAIDSQRTVVAGPLALKQGGFGVASRTPVYLLGDYNERNTENYWGIVSVTLDAEWLLKRIGFLADIHEFDIAVRGTDGMGKLGTIFGGKASVFDRKPVTLPFVLPGGGLWEFAAVPTEGWPGFHSGTTVLVGLAYALALCIGYLIYRLATRHQVALQQATHDPLTGLSNRLVLLGDIEAMVANAEGDLSCGVLCILDLDHFKPVNDKYGHAAGDKVLQVMAGRLLELLKPDDIAVRLGGDEFALLLKNPIEITELQQFCKRVLAALKVPVDINEDLSVHVGCSIGATFISAADTNTISLLERADNALYSSKNAGRDMFTIAII